MQNDKNLYVRKDLPESLKKIGFVLLAIGLVLGLVHFMIDSQTAWYGYILAYVFLITVVVGALFLFALEYVAGADWSVPLRRVTEFFASAVPLLIILVIPLLLNIKNIFPWADGSLAGDKSMQSKSPYLNTTFFIIRSVVCIGLWSLFNFMMSRNSVKQDETGDQSLTKKNIILSAIFIPVFAITLTMSAVDWVMSLSPLWYSTIYGIYFFAGSVLAALSAVTITVILLREKGYMHPRMNDEHYFSLGALLFAFINFWAYIAFSQFMLIWYANLPEETNWFIARYQGGWMFVSFLLIIVHFVVPYATLLSQPAKMDPKKLKFISIWILGAHLIDLVWLIMPNLKNGSYSIFSVVLQFSFTVAIVGLLILIIYYKSKKINLVPIKDPKLEKGLNFKL